MMSTPQPPRLNAAAAAGPAFLTGAAGALPSRTVAVLEAIKHAILAGELKPGQALVETDLAEVLGVSKTPVREALKTLAGAGLVTMNPYKGAAVRVVDDEQARHVYDARLLLEPEALARAVASGHDWRPAHQALPAPTAPRTRPNAAWPTATSTASSTPAAATRCWSGCSMTCATRPPWSARPPGGTSPTGSQTPSWEHEAAEHRAVLQAAEDGDAERAAALLRGHITSFVARNFPEPAQENQNR